LVTYQNYTKMHSPKDIKLFRNISCDIKSFVISTALVLNDSRVMSVLYLIKNLISQQYTDMALKVRVLQGRVWRRGSGFWPRPDWQRRHGKIYEMTKWKIRERIRYFGMWRCGFPTFRKVRKSWRFVELETLEGNAETTYTTTQRRVTETWGGWGVRGCTAVKPWKSQIWVCV
jgi:hypothetical protein